jgi:VWFA-related protein
MSRLRSFRRTAGRRAALVLLAGGLFGLSASPSASPSPAAAGRQDLTKPIQHEVSVVLKLIQVYVTDKKGRPVEDLGPGDFSVTDNGQPVVLTDFEKHSLQAPAEEPAAEAAPTAVPAAPPATRKFFLFFDFAFNNGRGIVRSRTAALHFLDAKVGPDDEVGILTYSMFKGVRVHEYLTRDHAKIREVVEGIGTKDIAGRASEIELQYWLMAQEPLAGAGGTSEEFASANAGKAVIDPMKNARDESKRIVQTFILRLTDLAKALRYVPGHKHFILFSTGVPSSIIYGGQSGNPSSGRDRARFDAGDRVLRTQNEEMYREFGASNCTFYAFDTRESAKESDLFAYDRMTFESGSRGLASEQGVYQDSTDVFRDEKTTGLNSLKRLTDITGGKYFSNIAMFEKNLEQVKTLTGTYYVLGYSVGEREDGSFHEIKVAVGRPGCEVRAQSGYFSPKPFGELTRLEKDLHLYDLALNERSFSRLPVTFPVAALAFPSADGAGLGIVAAVPGRVTEKFSGGRVEYVALVFDGANNIRGVRRIETDPRPRRGQPVVFTAAAALEPGDYTCRLVIRDLDTGQSAVGSARASLRAAPAQGLRLWTPLLLGDETGSARLDAGAAKGRPVAPWQDVYAYDRTRFSPVAGGVTTLAKRVLAVVPYAAPGTGEPDVAFSVQLIDAATGEAVPVAAAQAGTSWHPAAAAVTLEIPLAGLAPGTYHLYINAEDRASGTLAHARTTLVISRD